MSEVSSGMSGHGLGPGAAPVNPPQKTTAQRILLGVVIGLGLLIVLGLGGLVIGVTMKMRGAGSSAGSSAAAPALTLPAGASIEAMEVSGERLILRVKTGAGEEIDIVDTADGHVVSRIQAAPPEIPK